MNLIISIKPEFVAKIISKEKKYEFRRTIFRKDVDKIYIYSTSPEKRIVGYFKSKNIIEDTIDNLWEKCRRYAGISKESFFDYFKDKNKGFAIEISNLHIFDNPIDTKELDDFKAPQSFSYCDFEFT